MVWFHNAPLTISAARHIAAWPWHTTCFAHPEGSLSSRASTFWSSNSAPKAGNKALGMPKSMASMSMR